MAKTVITIQSTDERDIDLFFTLLGDKVGTEKKQWKNKRTHTCIFRLDFRELQKNVTNKKDNVTKKQNLSINKDLISRIELYRGNGLSFQRIADKMNAQGFKNSRGNKLNKMQVSRLLLKKKK